MLYRRTFVVANSQHRPLLFWFVIGPVLNLTSVLNTCWSATTALRLTRAWRTSVWFRIVRASSTAGDSAIWSSHCERLTGDRVPSVDDGPARLMRASDWVARSTAAAFFSDASDAAYSGLEAAEPMVVVVDVEEREGERCVRGQGDDARRLA